MFSSCFLRFLQPIPFLLPSKTRYSRADCRKTAQDFHFLVKYKTYCKNPLHVPEYDFQEETISIHFNFMREDNRITLWQWLYIPEQVNDIFTARLLHVFHIHLHQEQNNEERKWEMLSSWEVPKNPEPTVSLSALHQQNWGTVLPQPSLQALTKNLTAPRLGAGSTDTNALLPFYFWHF